MKRAKNSTLGGRASVHRATDLRRLWMRKLGVGTTRSTRLAGRCAAEEHGDCSVPQGWVEGRVRLASKVNNQWRFKRKLGRSKDVCYGRSCIVSRSTTTQHYFSHVRKNKYIYIYRLWYRQSSTAVVHDKYSFYIFFKFGDIGLRWR